MNTGQTIKEILKRKGLKQKWLASKLDISGARLSQMLKRDMKFANVVQLCKAADIPIDDVVLSEALKKEKEMSLTTAKKSNPSQSDKVT